MLTSGTVLENIIGPEPLDEQALERSIDLSGLDDVALDYSLGSDDQGVSGGQAQRISLARAIYRLLSKNKQILLLDEPTSAQNEQRQAEIIENLIKLTAEGVQVFVISHQRSAIDSADVLIDFQEQYA
jgi:ATP-binding cassette subfamily C protein CydD